MLLILKKLFLQLKLISTKIAVMNKNTENKEDARFPLTNKNFMMLAIGFVIVVIGFILMTGGKSPDPSIFSDKIFSFRRIVLAPIVIVGGFMFEIYAIMKKFD